MITREVILSAIGLFLKWFGFGIIIIASAIIWIPKTIWEMGLIISDNIRNHYTDD